MIFPVLSFFPLALIFIVLKLLGAIDWSWWWVLSPVWLSLFVSAIIYTCIQFYLWMTGEAKKQ